jgi:NAD(P)-dependent dehydrogenase (short-subunit alcohol dehydrogenase family)
MKEKVILITGASSGIGRAVALMLAARGAQLALAARNYPTLTTVADEVNRAGGRAVAVPADVRVRAEVNDMIAETLSSFGRIDALVHCAGVGILKPVEQLSDEDIDVQLDTNIKGMLLTVSAAAAAMQKTGGGRVVVPVGTMGRFVMRGSAAYSASKWGAVGALKAMATEWQRSNIGVSLLYLGGVDTPFWDGIDMRVQRDKMLRAEDAARAMVYSLEAAPAGVLNEMVLQPDSHQFI